MSAAGSSLVSRHYLNASTSLSAGPGTAHGRMRYRALWPCSGCHAMDGAHDAVLCAHFRAVLP